MKSFLGFCERIYAVTFQALDFGRVDQVEHRREDLLQQRRFGPCQSCHVDIGVRNTVRFSSSARALYTNIDQVAERCDEGRNSISRLAWATVEHNVNAASNSLGEHLRCTLQIFRGEDVGCWNVPPLLQQYALIWLACSEVDIVCTKISCECNCRFTNRIRCLMNQNGLTCFQTS